jgi:hypothetical protein
MFLAYWAEDHAKWFLLVFAGGTAVTAVYGAMVQAYPLTIIEALWTLIAIQRFFKRHQAEAVLA